MVWCGGGAGVEGEEMIGGCLVNNVFDEKYVIRFGGGWDFILFFWLLWIVNEKGSEVKRNSTFLRCTSMAWLIRSSCDIFLYRKIWLKYILVRMETCVSVCASDS